MRILHDHITDIKMQKMSKIHLYRFALPASKIIERKVSTYFHMIILHPTSQFSPSSIDFHQICAHPQVKQKEMSKMNMKASWLISNTAYQQSQWKPDSTYSSTCPKHERCYTYPSCQIQSPWTSTSLYCRLTESFIKCSQNQHKSYDRPAFSSLQNIVIVKSEMT